MLNSIILFCALITSVTTFFNGFSLVAEETINKTNTSKTKTENLFFRDLFIASFLWSLLFFLTHN